MLEERGYTANCPRADTAPGCGHPTLGGTPGSVRGHSPREQRPQRGVRGPARERVPGGPGA
eukprot:1624409-Alexandrium_andersonii.AAC.1